MPLKLCELGTALPSPEPAQRVRERRFCLADSHQGRRGDGGVRQPGLGTLEGESTGITYTQHRFMFFSLTSSQNHFEKILHLLTDPQCKRVLQSWLTQSRPRASTPENAALQGILINLAAFKTLIKIRTTSSHFYFFNCFYFLFSNIKSTCSPPCNFPISPSILFPDLLKFLQAAHLRQGSKSGVCYPSLLADPQV